MPFSDRTPSVRASTLPFLERMILYARNILEYMRALGEFRISGAVFVKMYEVVE